MVTYVSFERWENTEVPEGCKIGYAIRTVTLMIPEGGEIAEELVEVTDPEGNTIAYFAEDDVAQMFCDMMNQRFHP